MHLEEQHAFTLDEAEQRLKLLVEYWQRKYGVDVRWEDHQVHLRGKAMGIEVQASVKVEPSKLVAEGKDPGLLFRAAAVSYLKKKMGQYFDPHVTVADLASLARG